MFSKTAFFATALIASFQVAEARRNRRQFAIAQLDEYDGSGIEGMVILSQRVRNGFGQQISSQEYANELSAEGEYFIVARDGCENEGEDFGLVSIIADEDGTHIGEGSLEDDFDFVVGDLWGLSLAILDD